MLPFSLTRQSLAPGAARAPVFVPATTTPKAAPKSPTNPAVSGIHKHALAPPPKLELPPSHVLSPAAGTPLPRPLSPPPATPHHLVNPASDPGAPSTGDSVADPRRVRKKGTKPLPPPPLPPRD
jgi:hypothetical protein